MNKFIVKPNIVVWQIHMIVAIVAVIGLVIVESYQVDVKQPYFDKKVQAASYMLQGMEILRRYRLQNVGAISRKSDPMRSGLMGVLSSPITSTTMDIDSKLTTVNPNWAAVIVEMLKEANIPDGSTVAVSFTGSFPAMNLAVLSAAKAMDLRLIIITSVSASTWGANIPGFTWLDMEQALNAESFTAMRTVAASLGGVRDNALGMSEEAKNILRNTILKYNIQLLEIDDIKTNITERMEIYHDQARDRQIAAYINVGGGTVAVGSFIGKMRYRPGLNVKPRARALRIDSVMTRFARNGVPVINMNYMKTLARRYNLPVAQKKIPKIGQGEIFYRMEYNKPLVAVVLLVILLFLLLFLKMEIGSRIFPMLAKSGKARPGQKMV
ncbi:MAG: poly-gamma-glutamate system protein [Spirochaetes bacterium]|nr:poly-gamma-glutamate system protein [Spirochaetota bacterium]